MKRLQFMGLLLAAAASTLAVSPVSAQQSALGAAKDSGSIGEKTDGYLGIVGQATSPLQRLVDDINIRRKALYAQKAQEKGATIEQYAVTVGCQAISRTKPGQKYEAPDGTWKTRTDAPPERLAVCP
ncbi:MAG: YdbL family protein [Erythrobacter sp.]